MRLLIFFKWMSINVEKQPPNIIWYTRKKVGIIEKIPRLVTSKRIKRG